MDATTGHTLKVYVPFADELHLPEAPAPHSDLVPFVPKIFSPDIAGNAENLRRIRVNEQLEAGAIVAATIHLPEHGRGVCVLERRGDGGARIAAAFFGTSPELLGPGVINVDPAAWGSSVRGRSAVIGAEYDLQCADSVGQHKLLSLLETHSVTVTADGYIDQSHRGDRRLGANNGALLDEILKRLESDYGEAVALQEIESARLLVLQKLRAG